MAADILLPVDVLRKLLDYDPGTGILTWKILDLDYAQQFGKPVKAVSIRNTKYAGKPALCALTPTGHLRGRVLDTAVLAHRVCWAIHYGEWPSALIDHINMNPADNRICNLRLADKRQNGCNRKPQSGSTSKFLGVCYVKAVGKWRAALSVNNKTKNLGYFDSEIAAASAYDAAARQFHGEFARPNFAL